MIQFLFSRYEIKECLYAFFDCDRHKFILLMSRIQVPRKRLLWWKKCRQFTIWYR